MNKIFFLSLLLSIYALPFTFYAIPVSATTINNQINIKTNTGGNTINGQDDENIQTGSSSTTVKVENQTNQSPTQDTNTQVHIQVEGQAPQTLTGSFGTSDIELNFKDGQAYLKTTDATGQIIERVFDSSESINIQIKDQEVSVQKTSQLFILKQNQAKVYSPYPLTLDSNNQTITVNTDDHHYTLSTLPQSIQDTINSEQLIDDTLDQLKLTIQNNQLVYQITGNKTKKLFGLFPFNIPITYQFDTQDGSTLPPTITGFKHRLIAALSL